MPSEQQLGEIASRPTSAGCARRAAEPDDVVDQVVVDEDRVADEVAEPRDVGRRHPPLDGRLGRARAQHLALVRRRRVARRAASSRSDRAAPRAARRRLPARPGSASRAPRTDRRAGRCVSASVTCRSCIASSSALCVFGVARLISSASRMLVKTGPCSMRNVAGLGVVDARAEDVGRQHVGRQLDALELRRDRAAPASSRSASWRRRGRLRAGRGRSPTRAPCARSRTESPRTGRSAAAGSARAGRR